MRNRTTFSRLPVQFSRSLQHLREGKAYLRGHGIWIEDGRVYPPIEDKTQNVQASTRGLESSATQHDHGR